MKNKRLNIQRLIFEFISVSFAVLIALLVNQWREDHNNDKLAEKAIYNIKQELQENKDVMDILIPSHKSILSHIDSIIERKEKNISNVDSNISIDVTLISSSAWEMAEITNAIFYLDFDDANKMAKVYNLQSYYESIIKQFILKNSNSYQSDQDLEFLRNNKQFLETIIPLEEDLQNYFNLLLKNVLVEKIKE
ncbi:MAG: hypothetical protein DRH21_04710 [Deltaproteobacteria bacterium]|nr:MAG: hypothetical protein DRH21_04710 [Deltaproteobacteria bacterium]